MEIDILGFGFLVRCKHERGPGRVLSCSWMWAIGAPSQSSHIHIGTTVELYINTEGHSAGRITDETDNLVSAFFLIMLRFARWWVTNHCFIFRWLFIEGMMFIVAIVFWLIFGFLKPHMLMAIFAVRRNHHNWVGCLIVNDGLRNKMGSFTRMGNKLRLDCARRRHRRRHRWSLLRLKCARLSVFLLQKGESWLTVLPLELTRSPCGWGGQLSNDCCYAKQETTPALLQWKLGMTPAPAFLKGWKVLEHSEIIVHGRFLSMVSAYGALIPPPLSQLHAYAHVLCASATLRL